MEVTASMSTHIMTTMSLTEFLVPDRVNHTEVTESMSTHIMTTVSLTDTQEHPRSTYLLTSSSSRLSQRAASQSLGPVPSPEKHSFHAGLLSRLSRRDLSVGVTQGQRGPVTCQLLSSLQHHPWLTNVVHFHWVLQAVRHNGREILP